MKENAIKARGAILLLCLVVVTWGVNWTLTKLIVDSIHPIWATAMRSAIASVALLLLLMLRRQLTLPKRDDVPVIMAISLLHMVGFSTLVAYGVTYVPVGRSIVLAYTTPFWVAPAAWLFLKEPMSRLLICGLCIGLTGVGVLFNPMAFNWGDTRALLGCGLILSAALCWACSIVYVRTCRWTSTPLQLVFWEALLATMVMSVLGATMVGRQNIDWTYTLISALLFAGVAATAMAFWAMALVNRRLPATTTALGLLATPVVGITCSTIWLAEPLDVTLIIALFLVITGIAIGTARVGINVKRVSSETSR
ncbi:DMT family transporter [Robbsia andropogonis]|uniref:DMT family transporter n=1 Tax=Robbsia andropogonis TaxID=28092 RepID=UPI000467AA60|nr:DMT family transporter [Robbsia andropogonis]MCP1119315.1 DMT family transporter [Robbsia andropogonis]MCP1129155.1 DMT family transporter [Robbsia andropogonis]